MRVIALTGSVAAGKSSVGRLFAGWGATVIDADMLVRELQRKGQPVFERIIDAFGPAMVGPDGELDRAKLRRQILDDADARRRLESIVHPAVEARRLALVDAARARGDELVIADIPLLFEAADVAAYDGIVVVDAPLAERRRRLMHDRGLSASEAEQLMAAQLPSEQKRNRATWVIDNDGDREQLTARARAVWQSLNR